MEATPEAVAAALNEAGAEWYSVGIEVIAGVETAVVGVTSPAPGVAEAVRRAVAPLPCAVHVGERPTRY